MTLRSKSSDWSDCVPPGLVVALDAVSQRPLAKDRIEAAEVLGCVSAVPAKAVRVVEVWGRDRKAGPQTTSRATVDGELTNRLPLRHAESDKDDADGTRGDHVAKV